MTAQLGPGMNEPATALLYLYITLASIDGDVESSELKAAGTRLAAWGVEDPAALRRAFAQVKGYQVFDSLDASLGHACELLRGALNETVRVQVVKDLMAVAQADGDAIHGEATLCNVVRRELGVPLEAVASVGAPS